MSFGYREYRKGLPKGVHREVGDLFLQGGVVYQVIDGPRGDLRLLDVRTGLIKGLRSWEHTHRMSHIAPGVTLAAGTQVWQIVDVAGEAVTVNTNVKDGGHAPESMTVYELVERLKSAQSDAERRAWLCETVELALKDAGLLTEDVTVSKDDGGRGLVLEGLAAGVALPEALVVVETLPDGSIIVGLAGRTEKQEKEKQGMTPQQDSPHQADEHAEEALTVLKALSEVVREPAQRTEIKTLVQPLTDGENAFTLSEGWKIEHVTIMPGAPARRFITISRTVVDEGEATP